MLNIDTGVGLYLACLEKPEDNATRLILADWLDESEDDLNATWAKVIRIQCSGMGDAAIILAAAPTQSLRALVARITPGVTIRHCTSLDLSNQFSVLGHTQLHRGLFVSIATTYDACEAHCSEYLAIGCTKIVPNDRTPLPSFHFHHADTQYAEGWRQQRTEEWFIDYDDTAASIRRGISQAIASCMPPAVWSDVQGRRIAYNLGEGTSALEAGILALARSRLDEATQRQVIAKLLAPINSH